MIITSKALRTKLMGSEGLKTIIDDSVIRIFAGNIPATADDSVGSATLLAEISSTDGSGVMFVVGDDAFLRKDTNQTWQGTAQNSGRATFFRLCKQSDTNGIATTEDRLQGTVNTAGADMVLTNIDISSGAVVPLNAASFYIPAMP